MLNNTSSNGIVTVKTLECFPHLHLHFGIKITIAQTLKCFPKAAYVWQIDVLLSLVHMCRTAYLEYA